MPILMHFSRRRRRLNKRGGFERTEQIEAVLQTVTEQVDQLQQQLSAIQQMIRNGSKITEWKNRRKKKHPAKWVYQIKRKDKETKPLN
ncbi:hypothetical protein PO124_06520 [Bacillus licheniformis]|nr:hypothetical protein [Bacillus licheniformis]